MRYLEFKRALNRRYKEIAGTFRSLIFWHIGVRVESRANSNKDRSSALGRFHAKKREDLSAENDLSAVTDGNGIDK